MWAPGAFSPVMYQWAKWESRLPFKQEMRDSYPVCGFDPRLVCGVSHLVLTGKAHGDGRG